MTASDLELVDARDGVVLAVHAKPRASRSRVLGVKGGALEVAIAAPPVDGEANAELLRTLAHWLRLPRSRLELCGGATGRHKRVLVRGPDPGGARRAVEAAVAGLSAGTAGR